MISYIKRYLMAFGMSLLSFGAFADWVDVTDLLLENPGFDNDQTTGWYWDSNAASQTANYDCMEFWNGYFNIRQDINSLAPGHYRLKVHGYYRCADNVVAYPRYVNGTENVIAEMYVSYMDLSQDGNWQEFYFTNTLKSVYSDSFNQPANGYWTNDNVTYYPDNMWAAKMAFLEDKYVNVLEFDLDESKQGVSIGIRCSDDYEYSNWCIFDDFRLEFEGEMVKATDVIVHIDNTELLVGESTWCWAEVLPDNVFSQKVVWTSDNPSVAIVDESGFVMTVGVGKANIIAKTADGSNLSASVTINVKSGDDLAWTDVTDLFVVNPTFRNNSTEGWNWWSNASSQTANFDCMEFWNGYFNIQQTINGLAPGKYRLSAQAYYRDGPNDYAYWAHQNGEENHAYLFGNTNSIPIHSVFDFSFTDYYNNCWSYDNREFYPDGMASGSEAFARGAYQNSLIFDVLSDGEALIGLYTNETISSNWCLFDNFKLEYGGEFVKATDLKITIDRDELIVGEKANCSFTISPEGVLFNKVKWSSNNTSVATVDENGVVTAVGAGSAVISAETIDGTNLRASVNITVDSGTVSDKSIVINEIMASNVDEFISPANNFDGWIEFYNPTNQPARLGGLYVSDDENDLAKWQIPDAFGVVNPHEYKLLWFDSNELYQLNVPFKLDVDGGLVVISDGSRVFAKQAYPEGLERISYARTSDGGETWGYAAQATPGKNNATVEFAETQLQAPAVDLPSQVFAGSLSVNVTIPAGCTLRYTTDGTLPTMTNGSTSTNGQFAVNETMSYRFRLFAKGMLPSRVTTRSYIYQDKDYSLPILSVVSDPRFLYDDYLGVMVRGANGRPGNGSSTRCNWNMDWERPVNFSYITEDGEMVINQDANLEMCGGWSRAFSPHAFKLKGNKELGGNKNLDYPFFKDKPYIRNRTLQVRNGGNDNTCRFKDPALQYIMQSSGIDIDVQSYQPVHEFINGQYIGVLNVREPNNKHYVYANYGWDEEDIDQFEMSPDSGYVQKCGDEVAFLHLVDELSPDAANPETYAEICKMLDIDAYANYMAAEMFMGNWDWPQNNVKGFRKTEDGKFRFVVFDLDGAFNTNDPFNLFMGKEVYTFDQLYPVTLGRITAPIKFVTLFRNLLNNDGFRRKFIDAYSIMGGSVFEAKRALGIIDNLADRVNPAMRLEGLSVNNTANSLRRSLERWLSPATSALHNYYLMQLNNTSPQRSVLRSDVEGAQLLINGMQVPTGYFDGYLFPPVRLRAMPPAGYAFQGWVAANAEGQQLISYGDSWRYYDKGSLDNANWTAPSYSEDGWRQGSAPLGYGKEDVNTTLDYGNNASQKRPTAYFRHAFNLDVTPSANDKMTLRFTIDDGLIVYVNGTEAGRYNMPDGQVSYNTYASSYAPGNPDNGVMELPVNLFRKGSNMIAVEVHNNSGSSTDLYWDAQLVTSIYGKTDTYFATSPEIDLPKGDVNLVASFRPLTESEMAVEKVCPVRINEVSASNDCFVNDYAKKADWVELYNTTDHEVDVEGMYLTDNLEKPTKYQITKGKTSANTVIPPHGYLVIWCDQRATTNSALHASFKISGNGDIMALYAADMSWCDVMAFDAHDGNSTVGRFPDGAADVYLMNVPTIEKANLLTSYMTEVDQTVNIRERKIITAANGFRIVYGAQHLTVKNEDVLNGKADIGIYTTDGRLIEQQQVSLHHGSARISVAHLAPGFYVARATDSSHNQVACKFIR